MDEFTSLQAGDDAAELYLLNRNDILPEKFGLNSIRKAVEIYINREMQLC
jgi:hypothetical protein